MSEANLITPNSKVHKKGPAPINVDLEFIKDNFYTMSSSDIAKHLGIGRSTINKRAFAMGLRKSKVPFVKMDGEVVSDLPDPYANYQITTEGRVIHKSTQTLVKHSNCKNQYSKLSLVSSIDGRTVYPQVHKLVARTFLPNPEKKPFINHIDGNKHNPRLENLEWCTPKENAEHARRTGLTISGETHTWAKITEEQALKIIELLNQGIPNHEIVKTLPYATKSIVEKIKGKKRWRYLWD